MIYNLWITTGEMSGLYYAPQLQGGRVKFCEKEELRNSTIKKVFQFIS
jgi:hypothetical protein